MEEQNLIKPKRERHLLVTIWLVYILVNGISSIVGFTFFKGEIEKTLDIKFSVELTRFLIIIGCIDTISALFLLNWKKIGFHGIIIAAIINMYISFQMGATIGTTILGLTQIFFTYVILNMRKNDKSTWEWLT
ncbi:MAG: hypothetical protein M9887_09565 [Chitinophagales bacterium]|nr:hypothetical protein [Chitinophagales bacterium]